MKNHENIIPAGGRETIIAVLTTGAVWGIFEATAGYLLHLMPVSIGFLVWYPAAAFFLMSVYRSTGRRPAVIATAVLAASVKLLDLMLPGRIDRVLNPAVSIVFEGIAVCLAVSLIGHMRKNGHNVRLLCVSVGMNTLWRVLYLGYLAVLVPVWMREVSVLQSLDKLLRFAVADNICSSMLVWLCLLAGAHLPSGNNFKFTCIMRKLGAWPRTVAAIALLIINVALQAVL